MKKGDQYGFLIIELMIGLVIGLLTVLAITVVLSVSEGQRRATMAGEDAQISGTLALHALQQDIKQAGYGLAANPAALGCPVTGQQVSGVNPPASLAPLVITNGANGAPDAIQMLSSSKAFVSVPLVVTENHGPALTSFTVRSSYSVAANDWLVAVPEVWVAGSNQCVFFQATAVNTTPDVPWITIGHADLSAYSPAAGYPAKSFLINLGPRVNRRAYSVSAGNMLQVTEFAGATNDAYPEIVNLQAFYGKDTNLDGVIDAYDTVTPTTALGWRQVLAVRVALVARSTQFEKENVSTASNVEWDVGTAVAVSGTAACTSGNGSQCLQIKVDHLPDWQRYRYKIFDTLVPLRNILWNS